MKLRFVLIVVAFFNVFSSTAQFVDISDASFRTWLNNNGFGQCLIGTQLDTTCAALLNCDTIVLSTMGWFNIPAHGKYFKNLRYLDCSNKVATYLYLSPNLEVLKCRSSGVAELPLLPNSLKVLDAFDNDLTVLPVLPPNLKFLNVRGNELTEIPTLPNGLVEFDCSINRLDTLPAIPQSVRKLLYGANTIQNYIAVPDSLEELNITATKVGYIPFLPSQLKILECQHLMQMLDSLPTLPQHLERLVCNDAGLEYIPALPPTLRYLDCSGNNISVVDPIPDSLFYMDISDNNVISLSSLPDSAYLIYMWGNPINCIPELGVVHFLSLSSNIICLPNYGRVDNWGTANIPPLCDYGTIGSCDMSWNISGKIYTDNNQNCAKNSNDSEMINAKINLYINGVLTQQAISATNGFYSLAANTTGAYELSIDTSVLAFAPLCPSNGFYRDTLWRIDSLYYHDFAMRCKTGFDLVAKSVSSGDRFIAGDFVRITLQAGDIANAYNMHCANGVAGYIMAIMNGPAHYVSKAPNTVAPSYINGDTIIWNISDFGASNMTDFGIIVVIDTSPQITQQVCVNVLVKADTGTEDITNNSIVNCFRIVGSYDPNDKQVYPSGTIDTLQEWLTYTVRFQNTGTAEARHIYIVDTLDRSIDASSFQLLAYSHMPSVLINESIIKFNFPYINLPDSNTNEPASHGYIQYKAKLKKDLPLETQIQNTAYIYFDFNPAIVTNTVINTISLHTDIDTGYTIGNFNVNLYPNPTQNILYVVPAKSGLYSIDLYNAQGVLLHTQAINAAKASIDLAQFANGIYYIQVQDADNNVVRKRILKL